MTCLAVCTPVPEVLGGIEAGAGGNGMRHPDLASVPMQAGQTPEHRVISQRRLHQAAATPSQMEHQKGQSCSATLSPDSGSRRPNSRQCRHESVWWKKCSFALVPFAVSPPSWI